MPMKLLNTLVRKLITSIKFNIIGNLSQFMVPISPNKIVSHLSKNANRPIIVDP